VRKYKTDYAGAWSGYCKTLESAIVAGAKHVVRDGYSRCTIIDRETDREVARISLNAARTRAVITTIQPFKDRG
jgi:hypothetical protein